jgi:hypothetical protein
MTKDTGGPAFPAPAGVSHITEQGMTLRDYFASKAMEGLIANNSTNAQEIAQAAYIVADAMLERRKL